MDQVTQVREKTDLVSLISEHIPLKKTGRNFKANCPFHHEKTPSFVVSSERQMWHCFGCHKGGDAFTFLMEYENLEFPEALRILAKRAGIELIQTPADASSRTKKEQLFVLNKLACEFYHFILTSHTAGAKARAYVMEERKVNKGTINTFRIGFAPLGNSLTEYLIKKKGYHPKDLIEAGLASPRRSGIGDFFSNRLMFPLFDHRDNVVGFSGRAMDSDAIAKYVNTRETLVYQKNNHFFALNVAREHIKQEQKAIIMEGEFDVIAAFQEGITNCIAIKGSALTENQVNLIARFTPKIALCFDSDNAGISAMQRSIPVIEKRGLLTTVVLITNGKDPDEAIKNDPYAFKTAVKNDVGIYDFLLDHVASMYDGKTAEGKKQMSDEALPLLLQIENEIMKEHYLQKLSRMLSVSYESITKQLEKIAQKQKSARIGVTTPPVSIKKGRAVLLEEYLLSLMLQSEYTKHIFDQTTQMLGDITLPTPAAQKLIEHLKTFLSHHETFDSTVFLSVLPQELVPLFDTCFLYPLSPGVEGELGIKEAIKVATDLKTMCIKDRLKVLSDEIKQKEHDGEEGESLQKEFTKLTAMLKQA